jgi:hypothetical protein
MVIGRSFQFCEAEVLLTSTRFKSDSPHSFWLLHWLMELFLLFLEIEGSESPFANGRRHKRILANGGSR